VYALRSRKTPRPEKVTKVARNCTKKYSVDWRPKSAFKMMYFFYQARPNHAPKILGVQGVTRPKHVKLHAPGFPKGISHALKPVPKTMWERRNWSFRSQSPSDDRYGSSGGTPKKRGCECEKRRNARGSRDTGEALRPVSSSAIAVATMIQLIITVHSNR